MKRGTRSSSWLGLFYSNHFGKAYIAETRRLPSFRQPPTVSGVFYGTEMGHFFFLPSNDSTLLCIFHQDAPGSLILLDKKTQIGRGVKLSITLRIGLRGREIWGWKWICKAFTRRWHIWGIQVWLRKAATADSGWKHWFMSYFQQQN